MSLIQTAPSTVLDGIIPPLVHIQQQVAIRIEFLITEATSIEIFHYSSPLRQPLFKMARFQKWLLLMLLVTPILLQQPGKYPLQEQLE